MSWTGQSDDTQSSTIAATNVPTLARVTTGWPSGTALGPMTRTM